MEKYKEPVHLAGMKRQKMPNSQRAKQFMPFAAVTGLEQVLEDKRREFEKQVIKDEGYKEFIEE